MVPITKIHGFPDVFADGPLYTDPTQNILQEARNGTGDEERRWIDGTQDIA